MDPARARGSGSGPLLNDAGKHRRRPGKEVLRRRLRSPRALRPTRAGWCFFAITFGVGFAALNTGNNLLYLVLSLMLGFLVLSGLLSEASLRGIRVERRLSEEIFAGRDNPVAVRIHNRQRYLISCAVVVEDLLADGPQTVTGCGRCFALRIGPGESVTRRYALRPDRRGPAQLVGFHVSTRFPFGLFVKSMRLESPRDLLVFPAVDRIAPTEDGGRDARSGDIDTAHLGTGAEVTGLRDYVEGDSARHVHWRRSLRTGQLLVSEREDEACAEIEVLLRTRGPASEPGSGDPDPDFEAAVSRATSQVVAHLERGLRVGLRTDDERFAPEAGIRHRRRLLAFLACVRPRPSVSIDEARAS